MKRSASKNTKTTLLGPFFLVELAGVVFFAWSLLMIINTILFFTQSNEERDSRINENFLTAKISFDKAFLPYGHTNFAETINHDMSKTIETLEANTPEEAKTEKPDSADSVLKFYLSHDDEDKVLTLYEKSKHIISELEILSLAFLYRFGLLVLAIPFYLLFTFAGLSDGFVKRTIRRAEGARESGSRFHGSLFFGKHFISMSCFLFLMSFISISFQSFLIITGFVWCYLVSSMTGYFKKYA